MVQLVHGGSGFGAGAFYLPINWSELFVVLFDMLQVLFWLFLKFLINIVCKGTEKTNTHNESGEGLKNKGYVLC
jgi:hypothetical protein